MEGFHDNASVAMHRNIKTNSSWLKLNFETKLSHLC